MAHPTPEPSVTSPSESPEWQAPLFELLTWLESHCHKMAKPYSRSGLDPVEVQGEAVKRYLQRAPDWFATGETRTTPRRRAQDLLKNLVRHIVTEHKRTVNRERRSAGVAIEDLDQHAHKVDPILAAASVQDRMEAAHRDTRVKHHVLELDNPVYKLTLLGLYLWGDTHNEHFHDAKRAVLRSLDEAWTLFVAERATDPWHGNETHRRWTYGELLRSKAPLRKATPDQARTYYNWLNRTAHRAGIKLKAVLEADFEVLG